MKLKPCYSLLTLLILTTVIAGGVKLWYGPHHVVERPTPQEEVEYTFTRDWNGGRLIQGTHVERIFDAQAPRLQAVNIKFYRQNTTGNEHFELFASLSSREANISTVMETFKLSEYERLDFKNVIGNERQRFYKQGDKVFETIWSRGPVQAP